DKANFSGDLKVDSSEPQTLAVWLRGGGDASLRLQQELHVAGKLNVAPDRIALESFKAEIEGDALDGRISLAGRTGGGGQSRGVILDAALTGQRADLDAVADLARTFAGPYADWPEEAQLSLDIGRATVDGQVLSPLSGRIGYGPMALTLTNLKVG